MRIDLSILVIVLLFAHLFFALQSPDTHPSSYFQQREAEHIQQHGVPFYDDTLNVLSPRVAFNPVYSYIVAAGGLLIGTTLAIKLLPNLAAVALVIITYLFAQHLVGDRRISLFSAGIAGFLPILFAYSIHRGSTHVLLVCLLSLLNLLYLHKLDKNERTLFYIALFIAILHPASWIWMLGFALYLITCWLENVRTQRWEGELFLSLFFVNLVWTVLVYHDAIMFGGINVLWQNVPLGLRSLLFLDFNLFSALALVGIIPFIAAFWSIVKIAYREKNKKMLFLSSHVVTVFFLLWLTVIPYEVGLLYLAVSLLPLFPIYYRDVLDYVTRSKAAPYVWLVWTGFLVLFIVTSVVPSVFYANQEITRLPPSSLSEGIADIVSQDPDARFVAPPQYGAYVRYHAGQPVLGTDTYLMVQKPEAVLEDMETIYGSRLSTTVLEIFKEYHFEMPYVIVDEPGQAFPVAVDADCFLPVFVDPAMIIYEVECGLVTT